MNFTDLLRINKRELKVMVRTSYGDSVWSLDVSDNGIELMDSLVKSEYFYVEVIP